MIWLPCPFFPTHECLCVDPCVCVIFVYLLVRVLSSTEAEELYQRRVLTITGICVALLVVGIVCVVAYCKTKKQRKQMQSHLHQNQNQCVEQPNRMLANGPNHPGPGPEEIPMVD
ncbi:negative regulator of glucose-controlled proteins, partial [Ameca splendens]